MLVYNILFYVMKKTILKLKKIIKKNRIAKKVQIKLIGRIKKPCQIFLKKITCHKKPEKGKTLKNKKKKRFTLTIIISFKKNNNYSLKP